MEDQWLSCQATERMFIGQGEIHLWRARLERTPSFLSRLIQSLSSDEIERAESFRFESDRNQFIACRGILRMLLGIYLNAMPTSLQFCFGLHGKPYLKDVGMHTNLQFNLSHSDGLALYAVAEAANIGVDIERIRPLPEAEDIARQFFTSLEQTKIKQLPAADRAEGFLRFWTLKEAYLKASGTGIVQDLSKPDVSWSLETSAGTFGSKANEQEVEFWTLKTERPWPGYVGAIAIPGCGWEVKHLEWDEDKLFASEHEISVN